MMDKDWGVTDGVIKILRWTNWRLTLKMERFELKQMKTVILT